MMKLSDLIEQLTDIQNDLGAEAEVRLAHQPRYPFEYSIDNVALCGGVVYIGEGRQLGYLSEAAGVALEWSEAEEIEDDED